MTIDTSTSSVSTVSNVESVDELLERSDAEIIEKEHFQQSLTSGKKLRIKMGFDPTKPDLHLGHAVGLRILKDLQAEDHTIIFVIGDYTTKIGDPSGRNTTRPVLTDEEIKENSKTYFEQVGKILDADKTEIHYNSEWLSKMTLEDVLHLTSKFTVANIIERDDFSKRLKEGHDIGLHELLYPLMQAYDSVELRADVAFCGTDQKFNELAGRKLQKKMGQTPQDVVMVKLLVGLDGKNKMSKSLDNYIALNDSAKDMYGKVMSIPDSAIIEYFKLCTDVKLSAIEIIEKELSDGSRNPREIKAELAKLIAEMYTSEVEAIEAEEEFDRVFKNKEMPSKIETKEIDVSECRLDDLLLKCGLTTSKAEAQRVILQGGVQINNEKQTDSQKIVQIEDAMVVRVGKRNFVKIKK